MSKSFLKSMTIWSGVIGAGLVTAEKQGLVPEGMMQLLTNAVELLAFAGVVYGRFRASGALKVV